MHWRNQLFTDAQLLGYENFWDIISVEKTLYNSAERRGLKKSIEQEKFEVARKMKSDGLAVDFISKYTGLSLDEIKEL